MADTAGNDLPYGHLGHAVYDPEEQAWTFQRDPGPGVIFRALGEPRLVVKPVEDAEAFPSPHIKPLITSERHKKEIQDLVKRFPEVQAAAEILPPMLRVSEAVISATGRHDPLKGYLLGIGSIPSEVSHHTIVIAAFPSGSTGSDLQLAQVQLQKRGWADTKDAWIGVPTFKGEGASWKGEGAAIQQIVFGHAFEGSDAFLAARMLTRTLIFRPNVRSRGLPALKVAASPCFDVSIASTGRVPHADIAFNPWFTRQFGIVDQAGRWSVWELEGRLTISGRLLNYSLEQDSTSRPAKPVDDGWARIAWVCSPTVVAVCTRRQLDMFNGIGSDVKQPPAVLSLQSPDTSWHLAMVQVPSHPAHLAVLTSTHLTLYHVKEGSGDSIEAKTVLRMRHYRNSEDTTLSLAAFALEDWTLIALHSRVEPVINMYRLRVAEDGGVQVSTPAVLALPSSIAGPGDVPSIAGMHLWTINLELGVRAVLDNAAREMVATNEVIETAAGYMRDLKTAGGVSLLTPHDLVEGEISSQDIETSAANLEGLKKIEPNLHEASQDGAVDSQSAMALAMRTLSSEHTGTLTDLYDDMVGKWITPLSVGIPEAVRLAKEHLVRQAAIEVALASRVLGTQASESDIQPATQQSQQTQNLPVRAGPSSIQQPGASSQATSQLPALPTPSPSATPSVTTTASYSTTSVAPELTRLIRYTTFSISTAPSTLPRSLANVLAHWLPGSDPAAYDWRNTSRHLGEQDVEADEQMTEAERARAQRRAARHLRRQRREAVASEAATMAGSQALEIVRVGQPLGLQGIRGESQREVGGREGSSQGLGAGDGGTGAASQVVPGRFGGRPPARKKRKQGF
ncbi:hypothetical protein LTR48_000464 [Friedmanniomyces endolithicus]|nr:hypothetical protein LTR48_000464 [Friedmanniomyces endolithicus]